MLDIRGPSRSETIRTGSPGQVEQTRPGRARIEIAESSPQAAIERHGGEPRDDIAILVLHRQRR